LATLEEGAEIDKDAPFWAEGKSYYLMPDELTKGLEKVSSDRERTMLERVFATTGAMFRYLTWVVRPLSMMKQILGDPTVAASGAYPRVLNVWSRGNLWRTAGRKAFQIIRGHIREQLSKGGALDPILQELRLNGIEAGNWFEQNEPTEIGRKEGEQHAVAEKHLPIRFRTKWGKFKGYAGAIFRIPELAAFRETVWRSALADIYTDLGATREQAVNHAQMVMTDYGKHGAMGKWLAPLTQFTKFIWEQALRLTFKAGIDPVTGRWSPRGILWGPWPLVATLLLIREAWNGGHLDDDEEEGRKRKKFAEESLPERFRDEFTFVGREHEDGSRDVFSLDSHLGIFFSLFRASEGLRQGRIGDVAEKTARSAMGHIGPMPRVLAEVTLGQKLQDGRSIESATLKGLTDDERRRVNALEGGGVRIPFFGTKIMDLTPTQQYVLEQLGGWPVQRERVKASRAPKAIDLARGTDLVAFPEYNVGANARRVEEKYRDSGEHLVMMRQAWLDRDGNKMADEFEWLVKRGWTPERLKSYLRRGSREVAMREVMNPAERAEVREARVSVPGDDEE
jgi:hypothetical protein